MTGHTPVMLQEMLQALQPQQGGTYLDGTFGGGGYTKGILEAADCQVIALDRDPQAKERAKEFEKCYGSRFHFITGTFSSLLTHFNEGMIPPLNGIVYDFGVSSYQIDTPERGFSFRFDGPLDMRMSLEGPSAADLVNTLEQEELATILYKYGQERRSRTIAKAIIEQRKLTPIKTTEQLANLVKKAIGGRPDAQHPATLTFQALRIAVNNELIEIEVGLNFAEASLLPGGRLVTVTFHSLEDQLVKSFIRARSHKYKKQSRLLPGEIPPAPPVFQDIYPKGCAPSPEEIRFNPRARSARLRTAERLKNRDSSFLPLHKENSGDSDA